MLSDPVVNAASQQFPNSGCGNALDYYQAVFPGRVGTNISSVYFVNRDDGNAGRITQCA